MAYLSMLINKYIRMWQIYKQFNNQVIFCLIYKISIWPVSDTLVNVIIFFFYKRCISFFFQFDFFFTMYSTLNSFIYSLIWIFCWDRISGPCIMVNRKLFVTSVIVCINICWGFIYILLECCKRFIICIVIGVFISVPFLPNKKKYMRTLQLVLTIIDLRVP